MRIMRAQTSIEFMMIMIILLAAIGVMLVFNFQKSQEFLISNEDLNAQILLGKIKNKIDTAYLEGEGFTTDLFLPSDLDGSNYSVSIKENFVTIRSSFSDHTIPLLTNNINGSLIKGKNTLKNVNGTLINIS